MAKAPGRLGAAVSIVERGHGTAVVKFFRQRGMLFHWQCAGRGTATYDMLEILGIGSGEKDAIFSLGEIAARDSAVAELASSDLKLGTCKGFGFTIPLSAISNLVAQAQLAYGAASQLQKGVAYMAEEKQNSLILIAVDQGYTDEVMDTAKKAGAVGGTVIRARWCGGDQLEQLYGITVQPEQEILVILTDRDSRDHIMESVQTHHGLKRNANAVLCALPVERAFRMG